MEKEEIKEIFLKIMREEEDVSVGIAAIRTLLIVIQNYNATTMVEFNAQLQLAGEAMRDCNQPVTAISSGTELFWRYVTLVKLDDKPMNVCAEIMVKRGQKFLHKLLDARTKIATQALTFFSDGCTILTHSRSRVVLQAMLEAAKQDRKFKVYVTKSCPDNSGEMMQKQLEAGGVDVTVILDSAVGYIMERVDMVMVGAEGVTENGGIINKIGTYTIAVAASERRKPIYVLTESFKFSRIYPLTQQSIPNAFKYLSDDLKSGKDLDKLHPLVDYTPPSYIRLLFTDLGILTPSAVNDELIKLYL